MLVIDYDPHSKDGTIDSDLISQFVHLTILEYRQLPPADDNRPQTHRVYISSLEVLRNFVMSLDRRLIEDEFRVVMGGRTVYFYFLKTLLLECPDPDHQELSAIFQNPKTSFVV